MKSGKIEKNGIGEGRIDEKIRRNERKEKFLAMVDLAARGFFCLKGTDL